MDKSNYEKELEEIKNKTDKTLENAQTESQVNFVLGMETSEVDNLNQKYAKTFDSLDNINGKLDENKEKQVQIGKNIDQINSKLEKQTKLDGLNESVEKANNSITKTIKKVGKLALAVFGIRSAYLAVRQAASTLSSYNDKIGTDLEYIKFAMASALQPIIEKLISLVYKLLGYVNYLAKAWFGVNLFGNATLKNFNKTDKSAKKLKKTLSSFGFDELNILEDQSENSSDSEIKTPSYDLSEIEDIEPPKWLQIVKDIGKWIIDHWKEIAIAIGLVGAALLGIKIWDWITGAKKAKDATNGLSSSFKGFFDGLGKAAESIAILGGIALVIKSLTGLIDTFSKSGMTLGEVAGLLGIVLGELVGAFILLLGAMTLLSPSWQSIAAAAVIFAGFSAAILSVNELLKTMSKSGMEVGDVGLLLAEIVGSLIVLITALTIAAQALQSPLAMAGLAVLVASISAILLVVAATLPTILDACSKFINDIGPFVIKLLAIISESIEKIINALGKNLPPIIQSVGDLFTKIFSGISNIISSIGNALVNILNALKNLVTSVLSSLLNFINGLGPAIENFVDSAIRSVTKLINFLISGIEYLVNTLVIDGVNAIIKGINKIGKYVGFTIDLVPDFKIRRFTPKLASGGIVDVPKKGVNIGGAIAGEAGAEGVFPFTNAEVMERAGREIGKWVTVNIDLTNTIDGRVLNKRLEVIKARDNFSRNGG